MKKKLILIALVIVTALTMAACCSHEWADATCGAPKTCTKCGKTKGEPTGKHTWAEATCTEPKTCTVCGLTEGEALGHTEVVDEAVAPTCTEPGLTEGTHCSVCGEVITAQEEVPATGHDMKEATCTEPKTCTKCGATEGEPAGHIRSEATCTEPAVCIVCGEVEGEAPGHLWAEATCTEPRTCTVCGETEGDPLGHTEMPSEAKAPTCTEPGLTEGTVCAVCGTVIKAQETVPATGHTEVTDEAKAPTCTEPGATEGTHCAECGEVLSGCTEIPALGHTEAIDVEVLPNCTETGLTEGSHCSVCNEVLVAQETIPALGHTEVVDEAKAPTCTETGLTEGSHCSACNEVLAAQEVVPALGHTEVIDEAVPATCTETGLTEGKHCSVCSEVLVAQEVVPALGHTEVIDEAVPATCTETGLTEGKHCSVCNEVLVAQEVVPALGHNWVAASHQEPETCSVCGETVGEPLVSDFEKYGITADAKPGVPYAYETNCSKYPDQRSKGEFTVVSYDVMAADEANGMEARDGYEWRVARFSYVFTDNNARRYGVKTAYRIEDKYNAELLDSTFRFVENGGPAVKEGTFSVKWHGVQHDDCRVIVSETPFVRVWNSEKEYYESRSGITVRVLVPEGYDGICAGPCDTAAAEGSLTELASFDEASCILFAFDANESYKAN